MNTNTNTDILPNNLNTNINTQAVEIQGYSEVEYWQTLAIFVAETLNI